MMRFKTPVLSLLAGLVAATAIIPGQAGWADDKPWTLGDVQTFEVHSFEKNDFSSKRDTVWPEIAEYARTAIQNDERLRYRSPGEGVLHFYCEGWRCGKIRAELTYGPDGPVIWQSVERFRPLVSFTDGPDGRKFAKQIVQKLGQDYQAAMKAVPVKIQIKEEE